MKSVSITGFGGPEVIVMREKPLPDPKGDQVLVKIGYAGVNPLDWKVRNGELKMVTGRRFPMKQGYEFSGIVTDSGPKVTGLKAGDRVVGGTGILGGAYSEFIAVREHQVSKVPASLPLNLAAASYVCGLTSLQCLRDKAKTKEGDDVLLIGASGGVGSFGVQIGKLLKAKIWGVCSHRNIDYVESLGADRVIDYTSEDLMTLPNKFDLIYDAVNAHSFQKLKPLLKSRGTYLNTIPSPSGYLHQLVTAFLPVKKFKTFLMSPKRSDMDCILDNMVKGSISVNIQEVFSLENVAEAISTNEKGRTRGKIIIEVDKNIE